MKAVVLVGGQGTRLRPLTLTKPKQMLPVGGRPMIERVLAHLARFGVEQAVLALGYRPDAFLAAYPDGHCGGVRLAYAVEEEPLDTAGAIGFAASEAGVDDTFVVVNGDVLTGLDVASLIRFHRERSAVATIALTPVKDPSTFGVVPTDSSGRVLAFIEKPQGEPPTNLINAGTYVLEPEVLKRIPRGRKVSVERETFPALVEDGLLYAMASDTDWLDAGTPQSYLAANLVYQGFVGEGSVVDPSARVTGSVLGAGVYVGPGARVEGSLLLEGSRVGAAAVVADSILGARCGVGERALVESLSVLGDGYQVGEGGTVSGVRAPA